MPRSSPLSRGIRAPVVTKMPEAGIIPALAGNTPIGGGHCPESSDHPRSRGEYRRPKRLELVGWGSSPLSRGIRPAVSGIDDIKRIIPALAGNTFAGQSSTGFRRDHPRSRGEYHGLAAFGLVFDGSSPLSRGIPPRSATSWGWGRIIPALAGNTPILPFDAASNTDHPRSRGEYALADVSFRPLGGSSPLSRGIRSPGSRPCSRRRIIPALAGNTRRRGPCRRFDRDHPRSRGEYVQLEHMVVVRMGSSPLSRGIHLLTRDFISRTCRILGTPSSHASASRSRSLRVCGGCPPGGVSRLARHLKDLGGPSG